MNFLQNLFTAPDGEEPSQNDRATPAEQQQLSPDELRRIRLARLQNLEATAAPPSDPATLTTSSTSPAPIRAPQPQVQQQQTKPVRTPVLPSAEAPHKMVASTPGVPSKKRDPVNDALVQFLHVSLAPTNLDSVIYLPETAAEVKSNEINLSNIDAVIASRLYSDINDLVPRPTESPLRYVLNCMKRLPAVKRTSGADENPEVASALETTRKLLINFTVTYLVEPGLFPSACLAKSSSGACDPEHEAIDLLKGYDTSANFIHLLQTILPEVINQQSGKDIVLPILQKLSQDQKAQRSEPLEYVLAQLCCARIDKVGGWGQFVAEILADERKNADYGQRKGPLQPAVEGRRFEEESILSPFFSCPDVKIEPGQLPTQALIQEKRSVLVSRLASLKRAVMDICRASESARNEMLKWFEQALELNSERSKDRPDKFKTSSESFANNVCAVLLHLCEPFLTEEKSTSTLPGLISEALDCIASSRAFAADVTTLGRVNIPSGEHVGSRSAANHVPNVTSPSDKRSNKVKFATRVFVLTLRAVELGPIVSFRMLRLLQRQAQFMRGSGEDSPEFKLLIAHISTYLAFGFEPLYIDNLLSFASLVSRWFTCVQLGLDGTGQKWNDRLPLSNNVWTTPLAPKLHSLPEFVVSNIAEIFLQVGQNDPAQIDPQGPEKLRSVIDFFILMIGCGDHVIAQPHVRASMGDAIFYAFYPDDAKHFQDNPTRGFLRKGTKELVLENSVMSQVNLVPSLMRLYGDVQVTGYYQVAAHRQLITKVLGYLWTIDQHRPAFRTFAETSLNKEGGGEDSAFVKLANGILNQTNSNVAESLAKLRKIRETQLDMRDSAVWGALSEEEKKQRIERMESYEKEVSACLMMANDATDMLSYLSTDPTFVRAFTIPALRSRLVDMLCNILASLGSKKAAEFKIDNPEKYNFHPKKMLQEVFQTLLNCAKVVKGREEDANTFIRTVATCAYYDYDTFTNGVRLIRKHGIVADQTSLDLFESFVEECEKAKHIVQAEEAELGEVPDEFLDPIMSTLMEDPVILPGSKVTVDRATIMNHLLQNANDPFDRSPLDASQLIEDSELKAKIQAWKKSGKS